MDEKAQKSGWVRSMAVRFLWKAATFVQRHRTAALATSCTGLLVAKLSHHIFPEQTCKLLHQFWTKGQSVELSERLQDLFHDVLKDAGVASALCYRAFLASGFHPVSAGISWLPSGSLVGIPANFSTAEDRQGIIDHVVMINDKEVDWESKEGHALKDALTFSLEAQKFAISREVMYLQSNSPIIKAAVAPIFLAGTFISAVAIKQHLGLYSSPLALRVVFNLIFAMIGFFCYHCASDSVSRSLDYRADRKAAAISKDYARGGVEFYDKILSRNRILRALMGKQGQRMYAPSGNLFPGSLFGLKHTPYTSRRDLIVNILNMSQELERSD
ncbi:transmembrane protein 177 isoform X2 [Alligator sinensis]|uniref:Transmembrane protein 177 n=1 Tax=Alligator sinensis TaxID=38654 RepID=A0A3Q0GHF0_ALLSI|nr:transmembrane protein 177 isoform X2 [Alligator sinensis]